MVTFPLQSTFEKAHLPSGPPPLYQHKTKGYIPFSVGQPEEGYCNTQKACLCLPQLCSWSNKRYHLQEFLLLAALAILEVCIMEMNR